MIERQEATPNFFVKTEKKSIQIEQNFLVLNKKNYFGVGFYLSTILISIVEI